jgi:hypothetical protein
METQFWQQYPTIRWSNDQKQAGEEAEFIDVAETALHRREIKAAGICMHVETIHTLSEVI